MDELQDLKIAGVSKMNGGKYNSVYITGVGKIFGDLEANSIHISGTGNIEGSIKAARVNIEGAGKAKGSLECEQVDISGSFEIEGGLAAGILNSNGSCKTVGSIKAKKIYSYGVLSTLADVEADEIDTEGAIKVNGLLNASVINIRVGFASDVKEMGGEEIVVKKSKQMGLGFNLLHLVKSRNLKAELIEGTNISLEYTDAKIVRGKNIKIGPKSSIDLIEYSGELTVDPSSVVKSQKKI